MRAAGDDEPVPIAQREWMQAIHHEPDGRRKLERYAAGARGMIERGVGDVQLVVRAAATADPQIAALWADLKRQRLIGAANMATHLADHGLLRDTLTTDQARDVIWLYISPEAAGLLAERGWTSEEYERWLAETLADTLLARPGA